jgi:hypothetical protein
VQGGGPGQFPGMAIQGHQVMGFPGSHAIYLLIVHCGGFRIAEIARDALVIPDQIHRPEHLTRACVRTGYLAGAGDGIYLPAFHRGGAAGSGIACRKICSHKFRPVGTPPAEGPLVIEGYDVAIAFLFSIDVDAFTGNDRTAVSLAQSFIFPH